MVDLATRLAACFTSVFPDLPPGAVREASARTVAAWDSMATVTLITVVEEEFGVDIDLEDIEDFSSFHRIAAYLEKKLQG